jgi:hypothetical protein
MVAASKHRACPELGQNLKCDTLIVDCRHHRLAVAERSPTRGDVIIIVVNIRGGSTAASTSMLLWEIDRPLAQLTLRV